MKRWNIILPFVVIIIVVIIFALKRDSLTEFLTTLQNVQVVPFVAAFCCLFGRYFSHAFAYKGVFRCVDEEVKYLHIVPLVFSVTFANDCAPTAGMAGSALIAAWSHKQGLNMGKSVTVVFLEKIGYFGGFAVVMLIGFAILFATGQLSWYLLLGGLLVVLMIAGFAFIMWLGYGHVDTERRLFAWVERMVNRVLAFLHKDPMDPWSDRIAASFHEAAEIAVQKPRQLVSMFLRFIMLHCFDCLCFIFSGFAFGFTNIPLLMASYVAGFIIATFILQTIGAVEVLLGLVLAAYGCTAGQAAAIAICYRGLIFWVPFIIGAICINITGAQKQLLKSGEGDDVLTTGGDQNAVRVEHAVDDEGNPKYEWGGEISTDAGEAPTPVPPERLVRDAEKIASVMGKGTGDSAIPDTPQEDAPPQGGASSEDVPKTGTSQAGAVAGAAPQEYRASDEGAQSKDAQNKE